jgi:hypothetical protein
LVSTPDSVVLGDGTCSNLAAELLRHGQIDDPNNSAFTGFLYIGEQNLVERHDAAEKNY